jgi:glutamyl-tRNA synthetase
VIFSDDQAVAWFDMKDVVSAPARLDWDKLNQLNNHYIRKAEPARLAKLTAAIHKSRDWPLHDRDLPVLERAIPLVRDGAKTMLELADATVFVLKTRPLELPEKGQAMLNEETAGRLSRLRDVLAASDDWTVAALEAAIRSFAESEGVGLGKIGPALRMVLSGGSPAPDLAGAFVALGKDESLGRLNDALPNVA